MSTSPVTLDFSKSQPISEGQPASNTGDVSLDFSKSQPVNSDGSAPQASIGPAPKQGFLEHAQSLTQEGRAEHPVQAFIGDTAKKATEFATMAGGTAAALAAPETGAEFAGAAGEAAGAGAKIVKAGAQGASEVLGKLAAEHPAAAKVAKAYGTYLAVHIAHKLGLPLPKILEVIGE